jgi:MFS family permease
MNKQFLSFTISQTLFQLAYNIGNIFGGIFFYQLFGGSIIAALGSFAATNIVYIFFLSISAKWMGKLGVRNNLILATTLFIAAFTFLSFIDKSNPFPFLAAWVLLFGLARTFYHMPYSFYIMRFTEPGNRGESLGKLTAITILGTMFMPLLGGTISALWGVTGVALFSSAVFLLSMVPLFQLPNIKFSYTGNTLKILDLAATKKSLQLLITNEAENKDKVWQVYVFLLLQSSFLNFGVLLTIVNFICFIFSWFFGKFMDHNNRLKIMKFDSVVTALIWFTRPLISTPLGVTISNSIFEFVSNSRNQVVDLIDYDLLKRTSDGSEALLDEQLVTREICWNILSAILIVILIVITLTLGWQASFIFSGLAALAALAIK